MGHTILRNQTEIDMARHHMKHTPRGPVYGRGGKDWTCTECGSLLGRILGGDVHIRFNRRHEYVASLPASASCRNCGAVNRSRATAAQ